LNRKVRVISILAMLGLLASMLAITTVSAADPVELDKTHVTTPGGTIKVTLTDSAFDVGVLQTDETTDALTKMDYTQPDGADLGDRFTVRTQKFPILDNNDDGAVNHLDVEASVSGLSILDVSPASGNVTFVVVDTTVRNFTLTYTAADVQSATVKVTSSQDPTGFDLTVKETGSTTGVFEATFLTATNTATALTGTFSETDLGVDLDGDGDTLGRGHAVARAFLTETTTESDLSNGYSIRGIDLNDDGDFDDTLPAAGWRVDESAVRIDTGDGVTAIIALDLNDDGDTTDTDLTSILDISKTLDETVAGNLGVDLNNNGTTTDRTITSVNVAGLPDGTVRPTINTVTGALVTVSEGSRSASVTVETIVPNVAVTSPADGASTQLITPRIIVESTDADAGITDTDIMFVETDSAGDALGTPTATVRGRLDITIANGFRTEFTLEPFGEGQTTFFYVVESTDKAGNVGTSDVRSLRVDTLAPAFDPSGDGGAVTGNFWDSDAKAVETDPTKAKNTSIRLRFNEDIDGTTVSPSDFEVNDVAPAAAEWFSDAPSDIFLTVPALSSNARPKIELIGSVSDMAGNPLTTGSISEAKDRISPTIGLTISPALDKEEVTIEVKSDEALLTAPRIKVNGGSTGVSAVSLIGPNLFKATFSSSDSQSYNVQVEIEDTAGNPTIAGESTHDADDAELFEIDNAIPSPTITPADDSDVFTSNPFVTINWTSEGTEYGLDEGGALTTTAAGIATDLDTHDKVTLTLATLNGVDVLSQIGTADDRTFILATKDLPLDTEQVLVLKGQDDAGNEVKVTTKFTSKIRPKFAIPLTPGWNMISFPRAVGSSAINDVIPGTLPIDVVLTYDPTAPGGWLTATRGDDGLLGGTLAQIKINRAYWVHTSSFESLDIAIPVISGGTAVVLPTIKLVKGWNLVPVLDVSGTMVSGDTVLASTYFGGLVPARIYAYNPLTDSFGVVVLTENLVIGQGYWVFMSAAATLVP
jgi:hypothetical protein